MQKHAAHDRFVLAAIVMANDDPGLRAVAVTWTRMLAVQGRCVAVANVIETVMPDDRRLLCVAETGMEIANARSR